MIKRILIIGLNFYPELIGIGKYTTEIAVLLHEEGSTLRVITSYPYYPSWRVKPQFQSWLYRKEEDLGFEVFRCPLWVPHWLNSLNRILHLLSFSISSLPVMLAQIFWKPDLVLCIIPTLFSAPVALLAARLSGARSWLHIQDFELDAALGLQMLHPGNILSRLAAWFERFILTRFDRVSTISENMLNAAVKKGVRPERVNLLPNWVDINQIYPISDSNPLRAELEITEQKKIVLYHGNMGRKQGLEVLLEAAQLHLEQPNILFLFCGEGSARADLERRAVGLPNVRFGAIQPEEKLNQLVNLAAVHVLPQRAGAADVVMPSKLTTMLASGKPVIACAEQDTQLWKVVNQVGITVPPENAQALAKAILELISDPQRCEYLGQLGRDYACRNLEKDKILSQFLNNLNALLWEPVVYRSKVRDPSNLTK